MTDEVTESRPPGLLSAEITQRHLGVLESRIRELRRAASEARSRSATLFSQILIARCRLAYLRLALFHREKVAAIFGWRWAVALIGATLSAALFSVLFSSLWAGLLGMALGAVLFGFLVGFRSEQRIIASTRALEGILKEFVLRRTETREERSQIAKELAVATENQRELAEQLARYRRSQQYRLERLAARNWKAMRGGELEAFLQEVFSELQYLVERTGRAGDQGVDLVLRKGGRRIAIQVKGYLDSVPNTAIQEAFTGMAHHKCDGCAVITNSRFTQGGRNVAASVGCALIDENTLPMLIRGQIDLWREILTAKSRPHKSLAEESSA